MSIAADRQRPRDRPRPMAPDVIGGNEVGSRLRRLLFGCLHQGLWPI